MIYFLNLFAMRKFDSFGFFEIEIFFLAMTKKNEFPQKFKIIGYQHNILAKKKQQNGSLLILS